MATTPTAIYGWGKPEPDGSLNVWGEELNAALDDIDTDLAIADGFAQAALPAGGGTLTGAVRAQSRGTQDRVSVLGNIDWSDGNFFYRSSTLTFGLSMTFTNLPALGQVQFIVYEVAIGIGGSITWPDVDQWADGAAPNPGTGKHLYMFWCHDGATVNGLLIAQDIA